MRIFDAVRALNERKIAATGGERDDSQGWTLTHEDFRLVLVGLDLDLDELEHLGSACAAHLIGLAGAGVHPLPVLISQLVIDTFAAGVYYERAGGHDA